MGSNQTLGEVLHNGIRLRADWPPSGLGLGDGEPLPVPYLASPPSVVPINVGRQLFVDDFLIESSDLTRVAHRAVPHPDNPVLSPETALEREGGMACTFDDGVFLDPRDGMLRMYYMVGYYTGKHSTAMAVSRDGVVWERPDLGMVPGSNVILPAEERYARDNFSPWLDHWAGSEEARYKAYLYLWPRDGKQWGHTIRQHDRPEWLLTSLDGIRWTRQRSFAAGSGDCTSLYHDPFRRKWVLNVRTYGARGRDRGYFERDQFLDLAEVTPDQVRYWLRADNLDLPDPGVRNLRKVLSSDEVRRIMVGHGTEIPARWLGDPTQLYTVAPTPYESLTLGVFTIHYGPENLVQERRDQPGPKLTQIKLGYSRDGFHFARPDRKPFIAASQRDGAPDNAYLRAAGGGCVIMGDKLHFYYSGASGITPDGQRTLYAGGCQNLATLRRDGFVSLESWGRTGRIVTRPVVFEGAHLFVNADASRGRIRAALLDLQGGIIQPWSLELSLGLEATDTTRAELRWVGGENLGKLTGRPVRLLFEVTDARLYAFWVSPSAAGESRGFLAAGAHGHRGPIDYEGSKADGA